MEDARIVELYHMRSERAIAESELKYGGYCRSIALNILFDEEDVCESINDTWLGAWNSMPPHRPLRLGAFLGKLTRRISLNRLRSRLTQKRGGGEAMIAIDELSEVLPGAETAESEFERAELTRTINGFLSGLKDAERDVFVCRYFMAYPIKEISHRFGFSQSKTRSVLFRLRQKLKKILEEEGYQ